jgi:hypothetical protein
LACLDAAVRPLLSFVVGGSRDREFFPPLFFPDVLSGFTPERGVAFCAGNRGQLCAQSLLLVARSTIIVFTKSSKFLILTGGAILVAAAVLGACHAAVYALVGR